MASRPLDDQQLIDRARGGDAAAYGQLVQRHQQIAFRTAFVFTRSATDAEEAAQDGFVKAWRALARFRDGEPFRPWLLAIVANEARTKRRAAGRREEWTRRAAVAAGTTGQDAGAPDPLLATLAGERRAELLAALSALAPRDREVLSLRYLLDMSEGDMAQALACRRGTVKSRVSRALGRLRAELEASPAAAPQSAPSEERSG